MDQRQLDSFRERLNERQNQLIEELQHSDRARAEQLRPPGELSNVPTHNANRDTEGLDKELSVEETLRQELQRVDSALERIRAGTYGTCQRCGGQIAPERLDALPHAPYCIDCERKEESLGGVTAPEPSA